VLNRNQDKEPVVIKSVEDHPRVENERQLLKRFSGHPHIRSLVDEVQDVKHTTIVLKHLDDHLLNATIRKTLNRKELKYVLRCVLQGLVTLHEARYIHTGKIAHLMPRSKPNFTQTSS
jgi:serine/threonine protein kinase